jgi:5-formyltetrahydrofolate cyclo-ligase
MEDLPAWRAERRAELIAARQARGAAERAEWIAAITRHLRAALPAVRGMVIGCYVPFRAEPDLRPLFDEWRAAGADTALPVVKGRGAAMEFRSWWPGCPVVKGAFSLPMPDGTPLVTPQVVLMPPVGFDEQGYRLGYGGGYFDRTLAGLEPAPLKLGVAFELSRMPSIAPQDYDIPMDFIVTERAVYERRAGCLHALLGAADIGRAVAAHRLRRAVDDDAAQACASPPCYAARYEQDP